MLPVTTGFIFPDGSHISTGTEGHCKSAYKYIQKHNLQNNLIVMLGLPMTFWLNGLVQWKYVTTGLSIMYICQETVDGT